MPRRANRGQANYEGTGGFPSVRIDRQRTQRTQKAQSHRHTHTHTHTCIRESEDKPNQPRVAGVFMAKQTPLAVTRDEDELKVTIFVVVVVLLYKMSGAELRVAWLCVCV